MAKVTYCECLTCKAIKRKLKNPECPYCKEHHDTRVGCLEMVKQIKADLTKNGTSPVSDKVLTKQIKLVFAERKLEPFSGNNPLQFRGQDTNKPITQKAKKAINSIIQKSSEYYIDICKGKYTVYSDSKGVMKALRYGQPWQNLTGNNLVFNLIVELIEAKERISQALFELDNEYIRPEGLHKGIAILKGEE